MSDSIPLGPLSRPSQDTQASTNRDANRPPSLNDGEPPPNYSPPKERTTLSLYPRSKSALVLALFYAALVLAPWVITCLLANRPITGGRYGGFVGDMSGSRYAAEDTLSAFEKNERWYHAAWTIQTIASVLTLPLTSSICASAAVIYMQRSQRLTMPQLMTLADRGWMDRATYWRILVFQWPRYGSSFLVVALIASLLGLIIAPIQSILLTSEIVKTPTRGQSVTGLWDLSMTNQQTTDRLGTDRGIPDANIITILTRAALTTASIDQVQAQLWPGANISCDPFADGDQAKSVCSRQGTTFEDISTYPDPFFAQLPNSFHTGLLRQFLPRFNSSAQVQAIEESQFPENCDQIEDGFFVEYTNTSRYLGYTDTMQTWGLKACMPGNVKQSPWKATRDRHDFSEELYLDITLTNYSAGWTYMQERATYRITLNTTTGYFELPNYMNGGVAGFLLEKDPMEDDDLCDNHCRDQLNRYLWRKRQTTVSPLASDLQVLTGKGPLLTTAMALFGAGSFIDTRATHPEAFSATAFQNNSATERWPVHSNACSDLTPLGHLLPRVSGISYCIENSEGGLNGSDIRFQIVEWLQNFLQQNDTLETVFNAAAYISTKSWLEDNIRSMVSSNGFFLKVSFDMGADSLMPVISLAGVVVVSILLGIHLLILLAMGIYATWSPRWTKKLDSFAMMRIGASTAQSFPLLMAHKLDLVPEVKDIPGWMGDQMPVGEEVGVLGLGGPVPLTKGREYASYHRKVEHYPYI